MFGHTKTPSPSFSIFGQSSLFGQSQELPLFGQQSIFGQSPAPFGGQRNFLQATRSLSNNNMDTISPQSTTQFVPFNWSGLTPPGGQQQLQLQTPAPQPLHIFNPNQSYQQQQGFSIFGQPQQPEPQLFLQQQPVQPQMSTVFTPFAGCQGQQLQPVTSMPIFGQQQPQFQPLQQSQPLIFQNQPQQQYAFVPQGCQFQQPYVLQQPLQSGPPLISYPMGGSTIVYNNPVPPSWESSASVLPEKFMRSSLVQGRGPSILTPDPNFHSPLFDWGKNPLSGDLCATGLNKELLPLMKCPGEEVADRVRRSRSMERLELDTLKAQVKLLTNTFGRYSSISDPLLHRDFKEFKDPYPPPPPIGLFDQDSKICHLRDAWNAWQERRHKEQRCGDRDRDRDQFQKDWDQDRRYRPSPPIHNEGIDPVTGETLLEKFDRPLDRKFNMRNLACGPHSGNGLRVDTLFDLPSSSTPDYFTESQHKKLFHNHRFIGNSPTSSQSSMKYCPNGLIRLGPRVAQDLAPRYRPPARIGGNGSRKLGSECGVKLTKPNYYCDPDLGTLDIIRNTYSGKTIVTDFTVGHTTHGKVVFPGEVDVSGLDLDMIVEFSHKEVLIYPDGNMKPAYGKELNRRAIVTLHNIWPACKDTGLPVRDVSKIVELNYENVLRKSCGRFNGKFLSYNALSGVWVFEIQQQQDLFREPNQFCM